MTADDMTAYAFDNAATAETTQRFLSLEHCYDTVTSTRLADTGVGPGWDCLEFGAGSGSIADWLGDRVGAGGSVLATDIDTNLVDVSSPHVEVRRHDIADDPLPDAAFDLVHARLVLLHVPERRRALHRIWHALKPGGWLVLDEFDCTWLPVLRAPDAAGVRLFDRVVTAIHELLAESGADPAWGSHAYQALVDSGFVDVAVRGFSEAWPGGSVGARLHRANAQQTAHRLTARGLVSQGDIARFLDLVEHPEFAVTSYLMLITSGRRPPTERAPS